MLLHTVCSLAVLLAPSLTEVSPTPAVPAEPRGPGAAFASDASARLAEGWRVAVVDVLDHGDALHFELTLSERDRAERFVLVFDGEGRRALRYQRREVAAPRERRIYRYEAELARVLGGGPVGSLQAECGSYFLEGAGGGASVDPYDYYEVVRTAKNAAARRLLARTLADSLDDDMRVTGILPSADVPAGASSAIDIVLLDGGEDIVHVGLDDRGRVVYVELRWSPVPYTSWAMSYTRGHELAGSLRAGKAVVGLRYDAEHLQLSMDTGATIDVAVADFAVDEDEDDYELHGCPC